MDDDVSFVRLFMMFAASAIGWFKSIKNKQHLSFICFDIEEFYPSISQDLLNKALDFASTYDNITMERTELIWIE